MRHTGLEIVRDHRRIGHGQIGRAAGGDGCHELFVEAGIVALVGGDHIDLGVLGLKVGDDLVEELTAEAVWRLVVPEHQVDRLAQHHARLDASGGLAPAGPDLLGDDLLAQLIDLGLELSGDGVFHGAGCQPHAVVGQGAHVGAAGEGTFDHLLDHTLNRDVHILEHRSEHDICILRRREGPVGVHTDHHATALLQHGRSSVAHRACHGHDDVGALVHQALGGAATIVGGLKVAHVIVGAEDLDVGAMHLVVLPHTLGKAIHKDGHRGDFDAAKGAHHAGLGHARGEVASQEGGLIGGVGEAQHVRHGLVVAKVDDGELDVGVGLGKVGRILAQQIAHRDDQVGALLQVLGDILGIVGLLLRFEVAAFDAKLLDSVLDALPRGLVKRQVVYAAHVGHQAHLDNLRLWCSSRGLSLRLGRRRCRHRRWRGLSAAAKHHR